MNRTRTKKFPWILALTYLIVGVSILLLNRWVQKEFQKLESPPEKSSRLVVVTPPPDPEIKLVVKSYVNPEGLERKTNLHPSREYWENVFYADGQEVASYKTSYDLQKDYYDMVGEIPNGRYKFDNITDKTYGEENYRNGKKQGESKIYQKDGRLISEMHYYQGKLMRRKEFYSNGALRMEENFEDARVYDHDRNVGVGKVYFEDGKVMYEWQHIMSDKRAFEKSYNRDGVMVSELYFDAGGNLVNATTP